MSLIRKSFRRLHFPVDIIAQCVRWYLGYSLSIRNLEEIMAEWGIVVDHSTLHQWCPCWIRRSAGINVLGVAGDEWMKHISGSEGSGNICTGRSILMVRLKISC